MAVASARRKRHTQFLLGGILPIDQKRIPVDVIAGATLAALAIPEVMGYAKIAGTPVITGLYTLILPVALFALFGSSRHLVVGADSATAAILAVGLLATGAVSGSPEYTQLASLAALMCAVFLILARLLRLGFIANFLSRSVLIGFLTGVGIQVAMGQLGGMFGITGQSGSTLEKFWQTLQAIPTETSVPTLVVSLAVLGTILGLERVNKKIPGALIAVVGSIIASYVLDLTAKGVTDLGTIPGGLPTLGLPTDVITTANIAALLPTVISMVIVILAQSAATSNAYAMRYGDSFDENVDLIGLGLANLGAGISGTFVVNGSPTKTEMVDGAGGRSQISQLTAGLIVVVVLLFLTVPAVLHAERGAGVGRVPHRPAPDRRQGHAQDRAPAARRVRGGRDHRGRRRDRRRRAGDHPGDAALDHRARRPLVPSARPAAVDRRGGPRRDDADHRGHPGGAGARDLPLRQRHLLRQRQPAHGRDPRPRRGRVAQVAVARRLDGVGRRHRLLGIRHASTSSWPSSSATASRSSCATWTTTSGHSSRPMT